MKIDMHCHVSCGSIDSFVSLEKTIELLKGKGYDGMLITDHNSYKALKTVNKLKESERFKSLLEGFSILTGVEYDTCDGGHVLIILPSNVLCDKSFEKRGMPLDKTIKRVKELGGVIGLAHPYAHSRFGIAWFINKVRMIKDKNKIDYYNNVLKEVDFIEIYNGTVPRVANANANQLAKKLGITGIAGSDSHRTSTVGLCATVFNTPVKTNDELIQAIKTSDVAHFVCNYSRLSKSKLFGLGFKFCEWCYYWAVTSAHKVRLKVSKNYKEV